ncbi:hypothetical protein ACQPYE_27635 [Actinosynnema sp. CA-299493]
MIPMLLIVAGVMSAGSVAAAPDAPDAVARVASGKAGQSGSAASLECRDATSPGGARVEFCWTYSEGSDGVGGRVPMWRVGGTVYGESFGQVNWVTADGRATWQNTKRPNFAEYFTWSTQRPQFRACNSNGCGSWLTA